MKKNADNNRSILVCSACLRACCAQGEFMCDGAEMASMVRKTIAELRAGKHGESPEYWSRERNHQPSLTPKKPKGKRKCR